VAADALNKSMSPSPNNSAPIGNVMPASKTAAPRREPTAPGKFEKELKNEPVERANAKPDAKADKVDAKAVDAKKAEAGQKPPSEAAAKEAKTTQPLKKAATKQKQAVESAPAVAFLQGKFESLSPEQIPTILSDNEFISEALSEADVLQFLAKPASIDDLIDSLDLPDSLREEAELLGMDAAQALSPTDFLASIGVDPQRVFNELNFLKANIGSAGLIPSIQRAILGLKMPQGPMLTGEKAQEGGNGTAQQPVAPPLGMPAPVASGNAALQQAQAQPGQQVGMPTAAPVMPRPTMPGAAIAPAAAQPTQAFNASAMNLSSGAAPKAALAAPTAGMAEMNPGLMENLIDVSMAQQPFNASTMPSAASPFTSPLSEQTANVAAPKMMGASFDAYAAMGMRLDATGMDTRNLNAATQISGENAPSLEEALVTMQLGRPNAAVRPFSSADVTMPTMAAAQPQLAMPGMMPVAKPEVNGAVPSDVRADAATPLIPHWDAAAARPFDGAALMSGRSVFQDAAIKPDLMSNARPADELRLMTPTIVADAVRPTREGGDAGRDQSSGFDQGREASLPDMTSGLAEFKPQASSSLAAGFVSHLKEGAAELTSAEKAQLTQQIFDRASMLQKDGGGIVKLELPTENLGNLEMAVSLDNDRVDLRIIAGSERAREVMNAELNQLRSALSVQNLQLGNVDVGVNGRNQQQTFSQFSEQQQRRDQFDISQINGVGKSAVRGLDSLERMAPRRPLPAAFVSGSAINPYNAAGRLEVRA
jgi:hypothetical protein